MKLTPTRPVTLKTPHGPKIFRPGEIFEAPEDRARPFVDSGLLRLLEWEDPFKAGFEAIYHRLQTTFDVWGTSRRKDEILKTLHRMDAAWSKRDHAGFKAATRKIAYLVDQTQIEEE